MHILTPSEIPPPSRNPPADNAPPRLFGLVPCAGVGSRVGGDLPKQYRSLGAHTVLQHSVSALAAVIDDITVVVSSGDAHAQAQVDAFLARRDLSRPPATAGGPRGAAAPVAPGFEERLRMRVAPCGGATRAQTVANGLTWLQTHAGALPNDWVLVHDAARCLVLPADIKRLIDACGADAVGGLLAWPLADTLKVESAGRAHHTVARADKWLAQTPQMFRIGMLAHALAGALAANATQVTDEASALELAGHAPLLVIGSAQNFKLTRADDLPLAQAVLNMRAGRVEQADPCETPQATHLPAAPSASNRPANTLGADMSPFRIGEGWDVHALVAGRPLILGGVRVPHSHGLFGHSDADVLLHAITDALLGAAGIGDIGTLFPDTDAAFAGADSAVLLTEAMRRVRLHGGEGTVVGNVDCTVIAQSPKLAAYKAQMAVNIAACLGIAADRVNVKAKTAEKLGPVGLGQSMEARAVLILMCP